MKKYIISILFILLIIIGISLVPVEKTIPKNIPYQEAIYKTVEKTIYIQKSETRYKTETITKYRAVYYGTLKDSAHTYQDVDRISTFDNAIAYDKQYSGPHPDYTFIITGIDGSKSYYYDIDVWNINQKQIPYTDTVTVPYDVAISVPKNVTEQIIDRYETRYKTEYKTETKPLISWILEFQLMNVTQKS